ncbi:MAG: hypothetical protein CVV23_10550 [Ignavibacteriae bacterium HGW-Ignavibacteriae-2]|jgi:hypothetical protein|nr:MAG: hypothetical protein CVV23_10550 [Ignavibacteriae bacterium HGW-Ignavibacteriae-2]
MNKMLKKYYLILFLLLSSTSFGQLIKFGEAKGLFMSVGTGPRIPVGVFGENRNIGIGADVDFSYTDNKFLPVFIYAKFGYQHYPGKQALYKKSDYSSFSSNVIVIQPGVRLYLPPLFNQDFILLPVVEGGLSWAYVMDQHQFKIDTGIKNYDNDSNYLGFQIGAGFSMFLMDVMGYYNIMYEHQFLSFDLRVRIPIFVKV